MDELEEFKATYFEECGELLIDLEEQFVAIEEGDRDGDRLHAVFRGIHSIKGGAGAFNFNALVGFSHSYETLLDHVRDGRIELTDEVVTLCIRSNDVVADFVTAAQEGRDLEEGYGAEEKAKFDAMCGVGEDGDGVKEFDDFVFNPIAVDLGDDDAAEEVSMDADLADLLPADDAEEAPQSEADDVPQDEADQEKTSEETSEEPVEQVVEAGADEAPVEAETTEVAADDSFDEAPLENAQEKFSWKVEFTPHPVLFERANDPLLLLRELGELGTASVIANLRDLSGLDDFEPYGVYSSWTITLTNSPALEEDVREVFEFVDGDCDLEITQLDNDSSQAPAAQSDEAEPAETAPATTSDVAQESVTEETVADDVVAEDAVAEDVVAETKEPDAEPATDKQDPAEAKDTAEKADSKDDDAGMGLLGLLAEDEAETKASEPEKEEAKPDAAKGDGDSKKPAEKKKPANKATAALPSIRVDLDKVDRVVNMVGELVITQSMLTQQMDDHLRENYQEMVRGLEVLAQTTRSLQDAVMAIRAQPVKSVFQRMPRLVRELAGKTGKKIKLEMVGEHTEIDKTIIEQLSDPLTHMIRNSADHGIEGPETRVGNGKDETGTITLSAEQAGGNILISIQDDGAGINREKVTELAIERGVIPPDHQMTDEQIDNLIFAPGFSTVTEVSDISGRGVGMDVVLQNIKKIGGSVLIKSDPGRGTRMTLRLPLTLAVLEVMLVNVAGSPYVLPLGSIVETIQCARAEFGRVPSGDKVLKVRGEYVQVIEVDDFFGITSDVDEKERFCVLCEAEGSKKVALIVDSIIGQQQVVIKSLEENFARINGVAGGTILGDGSVALIVDVQGLKNFKEEQSKNASAAA